MDEEDWRAVAGLEVGEDQKAFIESNAFSMAESKYESNAASISLYDGEILIGYAMYGWYNEAEQSIWLDRFMIDRHFQGQGYAKRFIPVILEWMHNKHRYSKVYLSLHPDNEAALRLYQSFGFKLNGEIDSEGPVVGVVMEASFSLK